MRSNSLIGQRLREARERTDLSQKQLGIMAGFDLFSASPRINHYEQGRHQPNFDTMRTLAALLSIPTAYFYADDDDLAELILLYSRLNKKHQRELRDAARRLAPRNPRIIT